MEVSIATPTCHGETAANFVTSAVLSSDRQINGVIDTGQFPSPPKELNRYCSPQKEVSLTVSAQSNDKASFPFSIDEFNIGRFPWTHKEVEKISDIETFDGKIVYNIDGSAYIIKVSSEVVDTDPFPRLEGAIVDARKSANDPLLVPFFPQISNVYYFTGKSEHSAVYCYRVCAVHDHQGKVIEIHNESEKGLEMVLVKPILMCFACRLSFGSSSSFEKHSLSDHGLTLNDEEKRLLSQKNFSSIIQLVGTEKEPILLFLTASSQKRPEKSEEVEEKLQTNGMDLSRRSPSSNINLEIKTEASPSSGRCSPSITCNPVSLPALICPDHPNGRPPSTECPRCDLAIANSRGPLALMASRNSCKTLKCPKCNWHYKYQETLEIHMKEKHPENETSCVYCLTNQPHPRLARGETYTCGYKPYRCEVCNYSTTTKGNLSIHMQSDKHLNNAQELQNGGIPVNHNATESAKVQLSVENPSGVALGGASTSTAAQSRTSPKLKPTWRCDVCNYETNVARNLRIHMTSEKHTHNMMILQQNVKHMQQISVLQQAQSNLTIESPFPPNFVAGTSVDKPQLPEAALADLAYSQALLFQMMAGNALPTQQQGILTPEFNPMLPHLQGDTGLNPETMEPPPEPMEPNPQQPFQCLVCGIFGCEQTDILTAHVTADRSRLREHEAVMFIGGHYVCRLCAYKTTLKANFQLHCKTDKHLQRLQHATHIQEGGPRNDWKLQYITTSTNPVQIRCNVCEYYTNSTHKLQLHSATPRHESLANIYRYLSSLASGRNGEVEFLCRLCQFEAPSKTAMLQHVKSLRHTQMEHIAELQRASGNQDIPESTPQNMFGIITPETEQKPNGEDQPKTQSEAPKKEEIGIHCPLCQQTGFNGRSELEKHAISVHSVNSEGLQRLLMLVEQTQWLQSAIQISQQHSSPTQERPVSPTSSTSDNLQEEGEEGDQEEQNATELTCSKCSAIFQNLDDLYCHQTEVGHIEPQDTPSGPSYPCWRKGCSQSFQSTQALQAHFREFHALGLLAPTVSERHAYKFRCSQCSLAFKTVEKLQLHSQYHIIREATKCPMCGRSFRSLVSLQKHLETNHPEISPEEINQMRLTLLNNPLLSGISNGDQCKEKQDGDGSEEKAEEFDEKEDNEQSDEETGIGENISMEDYLNSQNIAEEGYNDPNRRFKCHRCKVAFTKQEYLTNHNKTLLHRKGEKFTYPMEKYMDPNRPFKCEVCKESFTQKNILLVHYNSVSHLHKLKRTLQEQNGGQPISAQQLQAFHEAKPEDLLDSGSVVDDDDKKPWKCNICRVSYSQSTTLDIHMRSVLHQTRAAKLNELISAGQIDLSKPLVEQPDIKNDMAPQSDVHNDKGPVKEEPRPSSKQEPESSSLFPPRASSSTPGSSNESVLGQQQNPSNQSNLSELQVALAAMGAQFPFNPMMMMMGMSMPLGMNLPPAAALAAMNPALMQFMMSPQMDPLQATLAAQAQAAAFMQPGADPNLISKQQLLHQQQGAAAIAAAAQQKRARTRITDDQLKILRGHFDINNSPSEEQIMSMAQQSGLPPKVIKHWFRNTLFKERQRNKDSPYNFNNPPSTTLNLDEFDKEKPSTSKDFSGTYLKNEKSEVKIPEEVGVENPSSQIGEIKQETIDEEKRHSYMIEKQHQSGSPVMVSNLSAKSLHVPFPSAMSSLSPIRSEHQIFPFSSLPVTPGPPLTPPGSLSGGSSKRANRTRFTDYQIKVLQEFFENNAYPKDDDLEYLSKLLNLSPRVIVVWFQNARQKARKVYENQPPIDPTDEAGRFQRTPGLNYQCKKCLLVFQRYYELIRHQKTHCFKEEDAKRSAVAQAAAAQAAASFSSDGDENSNSSSIDHSSIMYSESNKAMETPPGGGQASQPSGQEFNQDPAPSHSLNSNEHFQSATQGSLSDTFKCDNCSLSFARFDLWREHQIVHLMNPDLFSGENQGHISSMFQTLSKRKQEESEDERSDQPRDKRLRTTILPEQLDYLYQQYQIESNPSRKMLETISRDVGLKKRVVQVWFQNTRARERKGQFRAHSQAINKRCPFCPALFKVKSALESHLMTKHPEQFSKGDINIDSLPDEEPTFESGSSAEESPQSKQENNLNPLSILSNLYSSMYSQTNQSQAEGKPRGKDEIPLDLSKHLRPDSSMSDHLVGEERISQYMSMDDGRSDITFEYLDTNDDESNPSSPCQKTFNSASKRFRTQMSSLQVGVMKMLFQDYKTPTMMECETLGKELGLPKRVIQVWFQNARAKEKKIKGGSEQDQHTYPDGCSFCNKKYSYRYAIQDHIFTREHIDNLKKCVSDNNTEESYSQHLQETKKVMSNGGPDYSSLNTQQMYQTAYSNYESQLPVQGNNLGPGGALAHLQRSPAALAQVASKLSEPGLSEAKLTVDGSTLATLAEHLPEESQKFRLMLSDAGCLCKNCQLVFPSEMAVNKHQDGNCIQEGPVGSIVKLSLLQFECQVCIERLNTFQEVQEHIRLEKHISSDKSFAGIFSGTRQSPGLSTEMEDVVKQLAALAEATSVHTGATDSNANVAHREKSEVIARSTTTYGPCS
ncbi:zinc finger homeobox protein 3-like isoform X2 [Artemia franciscana]|uniref:Zinc finger homeobox protein 4 n=2 Tax=Artemia franciscana TaxID=6661 RepID=A0AA88IEL9_ARTSF|nr:hypothetical protein QYM36_000358 [Artemia franciscana]